MAPAAVHPSTSNEGADAGVTALLARWRQGDAEAADRLYVLVYRELRARARRLLGRRRAITLTPTALVHEAFLKIAAGVQVAWNDREHFYAVACKAMRQVLIDGARRRMAAKRGAGRSPMAIDGRERRLDERAGRVLELDAALECLKAADAHLASIVELHFFVGLSLQQVGHALGVSESTAKRDWRVARAFLFRVLQGSERP